MSLKRFDLTPVLIGVHSVDVIGVDIGNGYSRQVSKQELLDFMNQEIPKVAVPDTSFINLMVNNKTVVDDDDEGEPAPNQSAPTPL
jgi:hypothetical protein